MPYGMTVTIPDSAKGCVMDNIILSVLVRSHAFLVSSSCDECVLCSVISVSSGLILSVGKFLTCSKLRMNVIG